MLYSSIGVFNTDVIIHHNHWATVVSRGWAKASACCLQVSMSCAVLCHIVSLQYLSRSSLHRWLVSLVVFSCHNMVSKWWHARLIGRRLGGWYALLRTISFFSQCWLYLWLLSSPWPRCWSFYPCMWCWAYFFPFWSVRPQVCSVLVWCVPNLLHHMP